VLYKICYFFTESFFTQPTNGLAKSGRCRIILQTKEDWSKMKKKQKMYKTYLPKEKNL